MSLGIRSDVAAERIRLALEALAKEGKATPIPEEVLRAALEGRAPEEESGGSAEGALCRAGPA